MKKTLLRCRLLGHSLHVDAWHFYGIASCERCGREFSEGAHLRERAMVRMAILARHAREFAFNVRAFFCRCDECGKRFGRHRSDIDHLPF